MAIDIKEVSAGRYGLLIVDDENWLTILDMLSAEGLLGDEFVRLWEDDTLSWDIFNDSYAFSNRHTVNVSVAATVPSALQAYRHYAPDICIIDVDLRVANKAGPPTEGLTLYEALSLDRLRNHPDQDVLLFLFTQSKDVREVCKPMLIQEPQDIAIKRRVFKPIIVEFDRLEGRSIGERSRRMLISVMDQWIISHSCELLRRFTTVQTKLAIRKALRDLKLHFVADSWESVGQLVIDDGRKRWQLKYLFPFQFSKIDKVIAAGGDATRYLDALERSIFMDARSVLRSLVNYCCTTPGQAVSQDFPGWMDAACPNEPGIMYKRHYGKLSHYLKHRWTDGCVSPPGPTEDEIVMRLRERFEVSMSDEVHPWLEVELSQYLRDNRIPEFMALVVGMCDFKIEYEKHVPFESFYALTGRRFFIWPEDWKRIWAVMDRNARDYGAMLTTGPQIEYCNLTDEGRDSLVFEYRTGSQDAVDPDKLVRAEERLRRTFVRGDELCDERLPELAHIIANLYRGVFQIIMCSTSGEKSIVSIDSSVRRPVICDLSPTDRLFSKTGIFYRYIFPFYEDAEGFSKEEAVQ